MKYQHVEIQTLEVQNAHLIADLQNHYPSTFLLSAGMPSSSLDHPKAPEAPKKIRPKGRRLRKIYKSKSFMAHWGSHDFLSLSRPLGVLRYLYVLSS